MKTRLDNNSDLALVSPILSPKLPLQLPMESDEHYEMFLVYFHSPERTRQIDLARKLGVSDTQISRLKKKYFWDERIARLGEPEEPVTPEWAARREELRETEWQMHKDLLALAQEALERWRESDRVPSLGEIANLLELASRLGRLASGLALNKTEITGEDGAPIRIEIEEALDRIYGNCSVECDAPGGGGQRAEEVIDVQVEPLPPSPEE